MTTEVYLVVMHDRHTDDQYSVHRLTTSADRVVKEFKRSYKGQRYRWHEMPYPNERFIKTSEDGPWVRVLKLEMEEP